MIRTLMLGLCLCLLAGGADARDLTKKERAIVEEAVKKNLKDPTSPLFKWMPLADGDLADGEPVEYCGLVNAKNSYGGYVGFNPYYAALVWKDGKVAAAVLIGMATTDPASSDSVVTNQFCAKAGYADFYLAED